MTTRSLFRRLQTRLKPISCLDQHLVTAMETVPISKTSPTLCRDFWVVCSGPARWGVCVLPVLSVSSLTELSLLTTRPCSILRYVFLQ